MKDSNPKNEFVSVIDVAVGKNYTAAVQFI